MAKNGTELVKWHIEAIRITITVISVVVAIVLFGAKLDKQIALNYQSINTIQNNHLVHVQMAIDEVKEEIALLHEKIDELKTLILNSHR